MCLTICAGSECSKYRTKTGHCQPWCRLATVAATFLLQALAWAADVETGSRTIYLAENTELILRDKDISLEVMAH